VALAAILCGVVIASVGWTELQRARVDLTGVPYALLAMVALGLHTYLLALAARRFGWYGALLVSRLVSSLLFVGWIMWLQKPSLSVALAGKAQAALIGALDVTAFAAFARGIQVGRVAVVTGLASAFPLIPMAGGVVLLGERPEPIRIGGALVVIVGLVMLALYQ
jgi:drug/metabolite transporter (DMT)-like permease